MRKFVLVTMVGLFAFSGVSAQVGKARRDSVSSSFSWNELSVPDFAVMYLWREPDKHHFEDRKWWDNLSIDVFWAPEYMWQPGQYDFSLYQAGLALNKRFEKGRSLRVGFEYNSPYYNFDPNLPDYEEVLKPIEGKNMDRYKITADWIWNLTNLYFGYDREDIWNFSLLMGAQAGFIRTTAGGRIETNDKYRSHTYGGHKGYAKVLGVGIGLQARKFISPNFSFFVEPRYNLTNDSYDGGMNQFGWDLFPSLYTGFGYHLVGQNRLIETGNEHAEFLDNLFFQLSPGITVVPHPKGVSVPEGNSDGYISTLTSGPGLNINLSAGKWINRALALRFDLYTEVYRHALENYPKKSWFGSRFTTHAGLRGLGDFDLMYGLIDRNAVGRFGLELLAGLDMGYMNKRQGAFSTEKFKPGEVVDNQNFYYGPVVGLQGKYFMNRNLAVFVEGRYTYDKYYWEESKGHHWKAESIYDLSAGLEFYNTRWDRYTPKNSFSEPIEDHRRGWYFQLGNGYVLPVNSGEDYYDYSVVHSIGAGFQITPEQGVRARADFQFVHGNYTKSHNNITTKNRIMVAADYMYNLTNLWLGQDSARTVQVQALAGPVLHRVQHEEGDDGWPTLGAELGFNMSTRIAEQWDLFIEPRYELLWGNSHWDVQAGLSYALNQKPYQVSPFKKMSAFTDYVQLMGGWQNYAIDAQYPDGYYDGKKPIVKGLWDLQVGRWMGEDYWAIQGSMFYHHNNLYNRRVVYDKRTHYFGARIEAVFDVLKFHQEKREVMSPLRWTLSGGIEGGYMHNLHENFGFTFASQLQYHIASQYGLVAQARLPMITQNRSDLLMPIDLSVGVQYGGWGRRVAERVVINKHRPERARGYVQVLAGPELWSIDSRVMDPGTKFQLRKYEQFGQFDLTYGHWLGNGQWGAQASAVAAKYALYNISDVRDWTTNYMGGRVEGVWDPLYIAQTNRGSNGLFKWVITAGVEAGKPENIDFNVGLTASTQLQVRVWNDLSAVLSARTTMLHVSDEHTMMPLIFQGGLMYTLPQDGTISTKVKGLFQRLTKN